MPLRSLISRLVLALVVLPLNASAAEPPLDYPPAVKSIVEQRCMVCHGCYDAPCQLKLDDWIGLERGAHKNKVYDGTRLLPANLTRLYQDAHSTAEWREKGFFPVIAHRNPTEGVLYKMLSLKQKNPLPTVGPLPANFDFSLDRDQSCPRDNQFDEYTDQRPYQGMPYGFPGLDAKRLAIVKKWLGDGAPGVAVPARPAAELNAVDRWEAFFNDDTLKSRLMSRYIFEHLFIGNLYFSDLDSSGWYKLVRSRTPPGKPIDLIASRRPYDDPGVDRVYYRLQWRQTSILDKRHMPYALDSARMARWRTLFLEQDYAVEALPGYGEELAGNPFLVFQQLPVDARYWFMLDEAQFTIMAYIKGPVCRGQVALNVIEDHFWVAFVRPGKLDPDLHASFLIEENKNMRLPQPKGSLVVTLVQWRNYANGQKALMRAKDERIAAYLDNNDLALDLDIIWDGSPGANNNAALTVFRHWDSATVVKGHVGQPPKTMWVIDYSLLERIHYLLVAGFDVYGAVGHQLESRLYMDFLRMEGERNFLMFLPEQDRRALRNQWYRGAKDHVEEFVFPSDVQHYEQQTGVIFHSEDHKVELMSMLQNHIAGARDHAYRIEEPLLQALMDKPGKHFSYLPEVMFVQVLETDGGSEAYTVVLNRAHTNVAHLLDEEDRLVPEEDTVTVVDGFVGSYPNMFFQVLRGDLEKFIRDIEALDGDAAYTALVDQYGVRRTAPWFWKVSDTLHEEHRQEQPIAAGIFDLNRYQNR